MIKKQVNFRLNPIAIDKLEMLQQEAKKQGYVASKADVIEMAIDLMYLKYFPDKKEEEDV